MSVYVQNLNTGEVIDSYREEHVVPPASVMKLLTTGAALEIMGPGFRFPTILEYTGSIQNGVLNGDLYIRGGCDPSLGWQGKNGFLTQWVKAVRAAYRHAQLLSHLYRRYRRCHCRHDDVRR